MKNSDADKKYGIITWCLTVPLHAIVVLKVRGSIAPTHS
jgi:hypothetical protein